MYDSEISFSNYQWPQPGRGEGWSEGGGNGGRGGEGRVPQLPGLPKSLICQWRIRLSGTHTQPKSAYIACKWQPFTSLVGSAAGSAGGVEKRIMSWTTMSNRSAVDRSKVIANSQTTWTPLVPKQRNRTLLVYHVRSIDTPPRSM